MSRQDVYTTYEAEQHSKARGICFVRDSGTRAGRTSNFDRGEGVPRRSPSLSSVLVDKVLI